MSKVVTSVTNHRAQDGFLVEGEGALLASIHSKQEGSRLAGPCGPLCGTTCSITVL